MELTVFKTNRKRTRNAYKDSKGNTYLDCGKCKEIKLIVCFHNKQAGFLGKQAHCKECTYEAIKQWQESGKNKGENTNDSVKVNVKQQPQAMRNLSVNIDVGMWKSVHMQAIKEDKEVGEMIERMVLFYMAKSEKSVFKL